ncbi:short-chain fatty acyl-CoA regulator family protein [Pseudoroseomonas globiformis]|uniref:Short-chain fatty acyl-CoA regulator family protein n=1 Tax=Teichococcus globiformis TaxID=2307229 RepID=A0ABV7FYF2_9PROT
MPRALIGRTIRRLRVERKATRQALAQRLGISMSYLNLIEADQRGVTASLLLKLTSCLLVDLAAPSGQVERQLEAGLREVMADPLLGLESVPEAEIQVVAGSAPNAARAVMAPAPRWSDPVPTHVVTLGCDIAHAGDVVYVDGLSLDSCRVGIGLQCRLCERLDCRSRAFPPLEHRLTLDPHEERAAPWSFSNG